MNPHRILALPLLIALTGAAQARACSVPVFRFALERWQPSNFEAIVFHRGPLTSEQQALSQKLKTGGANLAVTDVDLNGEVSARLRKQFDKLGTIVELPYLIVGYPDADAKSPPAWSGPLTDEVVDNLLQSPLRSRIANIIGRGETAVFILLESGDKAADDRIAQMLEKERPRLERTQLPDPRPTGAQPLTDLPLKVKFRTVRLSRQDPREAVFRSLALGSEAGLTKVQGPMLLVLFGRGRMLAALHDEDLTADELMHVAQFLCGECSCELKDMNPGTDLLFAADWDALMHSGPAPAETQPAAEPAVVKPARRPRWLWPASGATLGIGLFAALCAIRYLRRSGGASP
jgi:hypothetical protein